MLANPASVADANEVRWLMADITFTSKTIQKLSMSMSEVELCGGDANVSCG